VLGGDDGRHYGAPASDAHPGFLAEVLAYHAITDTWRPIGELPHEHGPDPAGDPHAGTWAPVTTSVVRWSDAWVLPSGEVRPGVRTQRVLSATLQRSQRGLSTLDYAVLSIYFAALVAMGVWFSRRERTTEDFFLGGRRIPWWAAGASVFGTQLSAITFMAIPAKSFSSDWVFFVGNMTIPLVAPIVVFVYLPFFRRLELTSAYEYLELRFGYGVRALGSASYLLFQLGRMGIVLFLPALALEAVTGIPVQTCILVMGVLATIYAVMGGIEAVIWTDVLQVVVLLGGALLSLFIIAAGVDGGLPAIWSEADAAGKLHWANLDWDIASTALWVVVLGNIFNTLVSYTSDQSVVQRYLATADEKSAARSIWTNAALTIPSSLLFYGIGTALWAYYRAHPEGLDATGSNDEIFPWFIAGQLPVGVAGLVIAGLFAAAMSSLDSSMNSMATVITTDFYRRLLPSVTERSCLALARVLTGALGIAGTLAALYLASLGSTSMLDQYLKVIGLFGGGLAGLFAAGIFLPRVSGAGATAGLAASAVILYLVQRSGQVHFLLYAAIGVLSCCVVGSLLTPLLPNPPRNLTRLTWSTRR